MNTLYLLAESDTDSLFYEGCAERVSGQAFTASHRRMRKGAGIGAVRASLKIALREITGLAEGSGAHFIIAMDNDRAPHASAPESLSLAQRQRLSKKEQHQEDRYAQILRDLNETLGHGWREGAVPVAVAVPVEMLESWLLLIVEGGEAASLPRFTRRESLRAHQFHHPAPPPRQLKDWRDKFAKAEGFTTDADLLLHIAFDRLDPNDLAKRCSSFALFKNDLERWKSPAP